MAPRKNEQSVRVRLSKVRIRSVAAALSCGDPDADGEVGLNDFTTFAGCFHLTGASDDCNTEEFFCSDLNGDGEVGLTDFTTFTKLFAGSATGSPPDCDPQT